MKTPVLFAMASLFAAVATEAAYVDEVLLDQPAGYWRLGEVVPNPAPTALAINRGSLGEAAHGEYLAGVALKQPGVLGAGTDTAASLDGGNDRIEIPFSTGLNPAGPFTVEAWGKLRGGTGTRVLLSSRNGNLGYEVSVTANNWQFRVYEGTTSRAVSSTDRAATNAWAHVVGVYDGTTARLYVNGVETGTAVAAALAPNDANPFRIGAVSNTGAGASYWLGEVDEVALFGEALAATVVKAHFDAASADALGYEALVLGSSPLGYWRLNETYEAVAANRGTLGLAADGVFFDGLTGQLEGALVGDPDTSVAFDKSMQSKIEVPFHTALNSRVFSVECWARVDSTSGDYRSPVTSRDDFPLGTTRGYILYATPANEWEFWTGTGTQWNSLNGGAVRLDEWDHLVGTYDGTNKLFYVNGVLVAASTGTVGYQLNFLRVLRFGGGQTDGPVGNYFFAGQVDEMAVYTHALSPDRVGAHYTAGRKQAPAEVAPTIARQPQAVTVFEGAAVSLSVVTLGSTPFSYQWQKDASPLPGQTNAALVLLNASEADSGAYDVVVRNSGGEIASAPALVTVSAGSPPTIDQHPRGATVYAGGSVTFTVVASGSLNLRYQWQANSVAIPGATNAVLTLANIVSNDAASYRVVVSNSAGSATSNPAELRVVVPTGYAAAVMSDRPVAYWPLGESSGDAAFDYFSGYDGTYRNEVVLARPGAIVGFANTAAGFDGMDDVVEVAYRAELNPLDAFTLECWVKPTVATGTSRPVLVSRDDVDNAWRYGYLLAASAVDKWEFWTGVQTAGWQVLEGGDVLYDEWVHLVATYESGAKSLFVNGELAATVVDLPYTPNGSVATPVALGIGGSPSDDPLTPEFFAGELDEVALYRSALSAARIKTHYDIGRGTIVEPGPLSIHLSGGQVTVGWATGTLESAVEVLGPWQTVAGAAPPTYRFTPDDAQRFFRVRSP